MELKIRDIPIFYETRGEGRPMLIMHGNPNDHKVMLNSYEPIFADKTGWRRIYVDLPGMGNTPGADWIEGVEDVIEIMDEFIAMIAPGQDFVVVGFSYGGYLARALAYKNPERCIGMMLMAPAIDIYEKRTLPEVNIVVKNPDLFADLPDQIRRIFESAIAVQTEYVVRRSREDILPAILGADHEFLGRIRPNFHLSYQEEMNKIVFDKPGLFLLGRQDTVVGYADASSLHHLYPRTSIVTLDRCGHGPLLDQKDLFEVLTSEWIFRVEEMLEKQKQTA